MSDKKTLDETTSRPNETAFHLIIDEEKWWAAFRTARLAGHTDPALDDVLAEQSDAKPQIKK